MWSGLPESESLNHDTFGPVGEHCSPKCANTDSISETNPSKTQFKRSHVIPPGVRAISRYKPALQSTSSCVLGTSQQVGVSP